MNVLKSLGKFIWGNYEELNVHWSHK